MPAKSKTSGAHNAAPKNSGKKTAAKSAAKKPSPKAAQKKPVVKAKTVSPSKPAKAGKAAPKAPAKTPSKAKAAKPAPKSKPAAKPKPKAKSHAAAPKPKAKPAKAATKASKPIVKKAATKPAAKKPVKTAAAKTPAKPAAKTKPKAAASKPGPAKKNPPAKPAKAAPTKKSTPVKEPPKAAAGVKAAPPAPKRAPKDTLPPPSVRGTMPRRRFDDEPAITIEPVKGPVKMTPWLIKQKKRLTDLRDAYLNAIEGVANETIRQRPEDGANSAFGMHQADAGSDAYDRDFALSLLGKEQDALYEINEALKRIEHGVYGICEMSGEKIPHERLEALPFTRYTVACQEKIEKQQMGGRWSRPVRSIFGLDDASETSADASDDEESDSLDSSRE